MTQEKNSNLQPPLPQLTLFESEPAPTLPPAGSIPSPPPTTSTEVPKAAPPPAPKPKRNPQTGVRKPASRLIQSEPNQATPDPALPTTIRAQRSVNSSAVPAGDVRLTANIREDLHLKLKIAAAHQRTTIGELIEQLVENYL